MKVSYLSLSNQWIDIRKEALELIDEVLSTGKYLDHEIVQSVEIELANKLGVNHVILVNSGTDALMLGLLALGIRKDDEVITVPNSFIASVAAIQHVGAKPVLVDVGPDHLIDVNKIESLITDRTRGIMPVHLEGKVCNMEAIQNIAKKHDLYIIEDVAQAFGSKFSNQMAGSFSDLACFSLHPLKNLNACGDGGFISTNDLLLANRIKSLQNHGQTERNNSNEFGFVSRFDSIQAAIIQIRLKHIDKVIASRRKNALIYDSYFKDTRVLSPIVNELVFHTYHTYNIEIDNRNETREKLLRLGIDTRIHYPKLITEQSAYIKKYGAFLGSIPNAIEQKNRILSIPIHAHLMEEEVAYVAKSILGV